MEWSCLQDVNDIRAALKRRDELLLTKDVPLQSEVYKSLGDPLGRIILDNMNLLSKEIMGVTDPLKGPPKSLWVPPENRVKSKAVLVPPSPIDVTKAFLHQGILEIGEELESKVEESCLRRIKKAAADVSEFERFECERRLNFALECQHRKHQQDIRNLKELNKGEMATLHDSLHAEYIRGRTEYMVKYRCYCDEIEVKTQDQGNQTEGTSHQKEEEAKLLDLAKRQEQLNRAMKCLWEDFKEHLKIQRHILMCTRITEVMHVICAQKLDAQKKIQKVKQLCNEEMSRIAGNSGYKLIKDKYIGLMRNIKDFVQLAAPDSVDQKDLLSTFQDQIQRDIVEIEFEKNLCHCCQDIKNVMQESQGPKLHAPAGVMVYPKSYGENVFCTCHSTSEGEDSELKRRLTSKTLPSKDHATAHWSSISGSNMGSGGSSVSIKTESGDSAELPLDSDRLLAKKIAGIINIEEILVNAFEQLGVRDVGHVSNDYLQNKLFDFISEEFNRKFNQDVIMKAISNVTSKRKQSFIIGTRDSVEILKAKRSNKHDEFSTISDFKPSGSSSSSSTQVFSDESALTVEEELNSCEEDNEYVAEDHSVEVHKDVIRLSELRRSSCWKDTVDIKETNLKDRISAHRFWESLVRTPKYLVPPESHADPHWIYHRCTEEEWNLLMDKYRQELDNEDNASSSISIEYTNVPSDDEKADPQLLQKAIEAYQECAKKTSHPIAKMRVRSILDLLEHNDEVSKLLYKNTRLSIARRSI